MAPTVLFLYNDHIATEAMLGEAFTDCGYDVHTFEVVPADDPVVEVTFPDPTRFDAIVPLGARWSVSDDALRDGWVGAQMQFVRDAAAAGVPTLGVCFGGQLLAQAFGGGVDRSDRPEIGWYELETDRPELVSAGPWFEWHFDRWTVPPGATEIARTAHASQAFVLGRAVALQFHPELDPTLLEVWLNDDRDGAETASLGVSHDELRSRTAELRDGSAARVGALVDGFLTHAQRVPE